MTAPLETAIGKQPALAQQPGARDVVDGCHCATCTCNPWMTSAVRFDTSPAAMKGAIRDHLIALGWTPPGAQSPAPHPAITHCDNCGCDWLDNGLNPVGCPYCKQSEYEYTIAAQEAEIKALRAEVERLRADRDSWEQQASDRVADWYAEHLRAERLAEALRDAAKSMQTIADKSGRDEYLMTMDEVRGYANSRANAARDALSRREG